MCTRVLLELCMCLAILVGALGNSDSGKPAQQPIQPVKIINSQYSLVNGSFSCPEDKECTVPKKKLDCLCLHGLVDEPCHQCLTCGKTLGEVCGGEYGYLGECVTEYVCSADMIEFNDGVNISGICIHKERRKEYESCEYGMCEEGLNCTQIGSKYICRDISTKLKPVCSKDCNAKSVAVRCGSDGLIYNNFCALRKKRDCFGHSIEVVPCPKYYCASMQAPVNGNINYTNQTSIRAIDCNPGFVAHYDEEPEIFVAFPASLNCVCTSECNWRYGPPDNDKVVTFEDLPRCISEREQKCRESAKDETPTRQQEDETTTKRIAKNSILSNSV